MSDKIIRFPGLAGNPNPGDPRQPDPPVFHADDPRVSRAPLVPSSIPALTPEQQKALHIILHLPFVIVGVKPTDTGADFFSVAAGDHTDLRNAAPHLAEMMRKAMQRAGIDV